MDSSTVLHHVCDCSAQLIGQSEKHPSIHEAQFWIYIGIIVFLFVFAGLMSGLTLGLMSLGLVDLEVLRRSGTEKEKQQADTILPVVKRQHLLLVTLLLCNSAAMEALPIFLDRLVNPVAAVILSVTLVLLFGEIIPQAVCSRYGLAVGASLAGMVKVLMFLCYGIAFPISKILDWVLGESEEALFRRSQLKALVSIHEQSAGQGGELTHDEAAIISGALDLTEKTAGEAMTPIDSTFSMSVFTRLDWQIMGELLRRGHSRVPVYVDAPSNPVGVLLVKSLITVRPEDEVTVSSLTIRPLPRVPADLPLYDILNEFQKGGSHMAAVVVADESDDEGTHQGTQPQEEQGSTWFGGRMLDMVKGAFSSGGDDGGASPSRAEGDLEKGLLADLTVSEDKETGEIIVEGSTLPVPGAITKDIYFSLNTETGQVDAIPEPAPPSPPTAAPLNGPFPPRNFREISIRGGRIPPPDEAPSTAEVATDGGLKGPSKKPLPAVPEKPPQKPPPSPGKRPTEKGKAVVGETGAESIARVNSFKARVAVVPDKIVDKVGKGAVRSSSAASPPASSDTAARVAYPSPDPPTSAQPISTKTLSALEEGLGAQPSKEGVEPSGIRAGEVTVVSADGGLFPTPEQTGSPVSPVSKWWGKKSGQAARENRVIGIITLEDVIEELLQEEIVDETDEYIDVHRRIKVANVGTAGRRIIPPPVRGRPQGGPGRRRSNMADLADQRNGRSLDRDNERRFRSRSTSKEPAVGQWHTRSYRDVAAAQRKHGENDEYRREGDNAATGGKGGLNEPLLSSSPKSM